MFISRTTREERVTIETALDSAFLKIDQAEQLIYDLIDAFLSDREQKTLANGKKPKSTYRYRKPRTVCPYSASCFTCPLPDCRMGGIAVNKLPEGFVFRFDD